MKPEKMTKTKLRVLLSFLMMSVCLFVACDDDDSDLDPIRKPTPTTNKAALITDEAKLEMIYSLSDLEIDKGRIYEMNYTADYKLDLALQYDIDGAESLTEFVKKELLDVSLGSKAELSYDAGCSAFACPDKKGKEFLMGRNFDFNHIVNGNRVMIPVIAVRTAPRGGKKSISFVDGLFVNYTSGFYTDGKSDLSMLMAMPYLMMDGINEDGFAISVLKLDGKPTLQQDPGKKKIFTTVAMRMLLDRASTVDQAISMLKEYNMCMDKDPRASYHFFMADAKGNYAIVEYVDSDIKVNPSKMEVLTGADTLRYVTNFYVSPTMKNTPYGSIESTHGKDRYNVLKESLKAQNYRLTEPQVMEILGKVYQGPKSEGSTGFTQWSEMINLSDKEVKMSILGEYNKTFEFEVD